MVSIDLLLMLQRYAEPSPSSVFLQGTRRVETRWRGFLSLKSLVFEAPRAVWSVWVCVFHSIWIHVESWLGACSLVCLSVGALATGFLLKGCLVTGYSITFNLFTRQICRKKRHRETTSIGSLSLSLSRAHRAPPIKSQTWLSGTAICT